VLYLKNLKLKDDELIRYQYFLYDDLKLEDKLEICLNIVII